jgi:hypothetical protein
MNDYLIERIYRTICSSGLFARPLNNAGQPGQSLRPATRGTGLFPCRNMVEEMAELDQTRSTTLCKPLPLECRLLAGLHSRRCLPHIDKFLQEVVVLPAAGEFQEAEPPWYTIRFESELPKCL